MNDKEREAMLSTTVEQQCDQMFDNLHTCSRENAIEAWEMISAIENSLGPDMAQEYRTWVRQIDRQGRHWT